MEDPGDLYVIRTARTSLRPVSMDDLEELHRLWIHPAVRRFIWDGEIIPRARAEAAVGESIEGFWRHGFGLWLAEKKEDKIPIGFGGLRHLDDEPEVEILYGISPPEWGRNLATEISQAILRHGFEKAGLTRVQGTADAENVPSRRVLEKVGMTLERYVLHEGRKEARYSIRPEDLLQHNPDR